MFTKCANALNSNVTNITSTINSLATVAHSGSYNDLSNKPSTITITMADKSGSAFNVSANGYAQGSIYVAVSGWTPMTVRRISKSGAGNGHCCITDYHLSNDYLQVGLRNVSGSAASPTISATIVYYKWN